MFPIFEASLLILCLLAIGFVARQVGGFIPYAMMAAPDSYRADIPAEVNNFYDRILLSRAVPNNVHGIFAQKRNIPANSGTKIIKFRRYSALAVAGALTEGVTPTGSSMAVTDITATALQYGDFTRISDEVSTQTPDPILTEFSGIFGEQMALTNDQLTRDILAAGTVVQYASTAVSRVTVAAGMILNQAETREAVTTLKNANARKVSEITGANPGVGTVPINAAYFGFIHPSVAAAYKAISGFTSVEKYASNITPLPGEIGTFEEVRWLETTNAKIFAGAGASSIDVYASVIVGMDAYGIVDLANSQAAGIIFKALGSAGAADPLNQRATLGWKEYFVAKILNDAFMVRIEHALV